MTLPPSDRAAKVARLITVLERWDAPAIALTTAESLSWLFDGARVSVPYGAAPVLAAVVQRSGDIEVFAYANEIERLRAEEIVADVPFWSVPWHGAILEPDGSALSEATAAADLRAARAVLLPLERARYVAFCSELATVTTDVLATADPRETERALAARLVAAVVGIGADPVVTLVAGESRLGLRHPLPTTAVLGARAMAVVGARRHGLVANLTRWVSAEPEPASTGAILAVEADAFAATRPGRELRDVLADIAAAYERHGFGSGAWLGHHQGGPTGYLGRDPKATPLSRELVAAGQAFAWNPSAPAAKVEDTVIVDADRVVVLTTDPRWPTRTVGALERPLSLEYHSEGTLA